MMQILYKRTKKGNKYQFVRQRDFFLCKNVKSIFLKYRHIYQYPIDK